ncbi:MAG: AAA family ATPase [Chloroflexota bacterium]
MIGEAGVGKSRLIREFATRASAGERSQVLRARCLPYGDGVTFWPIAEIVRSAAGIDDEDPLEVALDKIARIARDAAGQADDPMAVADRVAAAIGLSPSQFPGPELFWGIRRLLEAIASRRPLVAIVDDIHVAAPTFLELLDHLVDAVRGAPILILASARHELFEARAEWAEGHASGQIVLEPLSADEADSIVDQLLGGLDPSVRRRILSAAEGNPLYVEQIASMLVETGAVRWDGDAWVAMTSSNELDIPPTVEALIAARLDALGADERLVIDPASVIGLGFAVDAVAHLVSEEAVSEVPARLRTLTTKQFVRPTNEEADFYRFGHAVIKDAAYRSLLKRDRAGIHLRFVDWAEPVNRERGRELEFEEILGYHLEQAYRYRTALGPLDAASLMVGRRAADKLGSAGRRAFGRGDAPAAANLLRRAASVVPADDPWRTELLPDLAEALTEQGDFAGARTVLDEAAEIAARLSDERLRARVRLTQMHVAFYSGGMTGGIDRAVAEVTAIADVLEVAGDPSGLARAWRLLMGLHGTAGRYERAGEAAQRVIEFATQAGDMRLVGTGTVNYSICALHGPTTVEEALARCEELVEAVREDRKAEAVVLSVLAVLYAMRGDSKRARETAARGRANVADLTMSMTGASTSIESTRIEMLNGEAAAAERDLRRDYDTLTSMGETYFRSSVAGLLAHALWALERFAEADEFAQIGEELSDPDDVDSQVLWRTIRAKLLARDGHVDEAIALAEGAVAWARETDDLDQQADALRDLAAVQALAGRQQGEGPPLREALRLYERKGDVVQAARVRDRLVVSPAI